MIVGAQNVWTDWKYVMRYDYNVFTTWFTHMYDAQTISAVVVVRIWCVELTLGRRLRR